MTPLKLYEGKAKVLYKSDKPGLIVQYFKDSATAGNGEKKGSIKDKGILNNYISEFIFKKLEEIGIKTHFIERINSREQLIRKVDIIPLEVVVRNIAAGSIVKRFGLTEGDIFKKAIIEYYYKKDDLNDPMVSESHIKTFGWASDEELQTMSYLAKRINDFLRGLFCSINIKLVDFKLEFGRLDHDGRKVIILADEFSPDNCRLWDATTGKKMDKDRFRRDLGDVEQAYQEVADRLGILDKLSNNK